MIFNFTINTNHISYFINSYFYYITDYFNFYRLRLIKNFNYELIKNKTRMEERSRLYNSYHMTNNYLYEIIIDKHNDIKNSTDENKLLNNDRSEIIYKKDMDIVQNSISYNYYTYIENLV